MHEQPQHPGTTRPGTLALGAALDQSPMLTQLLQRLQESRRALPRSANTCPTPCATRCAPDRSTRPAGPCWCQAARLASKLRQLVPALEATLHQPGLAGYADPHQGSIDLKHAAAFWIGAGCPNRTDDLPLTRRVLYQLS